MNLDELRSVQSKERQTDSLQHLRESFYEDVSAYISDLEDQRDRAAEQADDPFADPEVRQLTDEIETANEVVEAIYDRRLGKLVKRASLAAADIPADAEGLTAEEQELFDDLVDRIESNKAHVLDVLDADAGEASASPGGAPADRTVDGTAEAAGERTADPATGDRTADPATGDRATGGGRDGAAAEEGAAVADPGEHEPPAGGPDDDPVTIGDPAPGETPEAPPDEPAETGEPANHGSAPESTEEDPLSDGGTASAESVDLAGLDDRTTVRVTGDVDEFFGVDQREYDLEREDVVTLPAENAEPLLEAGDAERLD